MMRAFSHRYRWHKRFVPMLDRPNDVGILTRNPTVFADADVEQFVPNDDARTRRFATH